jgi:hypothetical protein
MRKNFTGYYLMLLLYPKIIGLRKLLGIKLARFKISPTFQTIFFANNFLTGIILTSTVSYAQIKNFKLEKMQGKPEPIVCPMGYENLHISIPPPKAYLDYIASNGEKSGSEIIVNYVGFSGQPEAQAAFQKAIDIWEAILISPVKIYVTANWTALGPGTLGSASPATYFRSGEFPRLFTWYPIALAEKLAGTDLNTPGEADINCNFNSGLTSWYFGTDANPPAGQYDFVSIVLHELGHGLGFVALRGVSNGQGTMRLSGLPGIYNQFVENTSGVSLLNTTIFPDPSTELATALISPLFFDSPIMVAANGNNRAVLYSPPAFAAGSSTSHVDQATYEGTSNGLMTPSANPAVAEHDPGPIMLNMFADMGWVHTYIQPDTIKSTETVPTNFTVKAKVFSDSTLNIASIKLRYSLDSFKTAGVEVLMTPTGNADEYKADIPSQGNGKTYSYYIKADDNTNRTYYSPSQATTANFYFHFFAGTDNTPPTIEHIAPTFINEVADTLYLSATITDIFGIKSVQVEYSINDVPKTPFNLTFNEDGFYEGNIGFPDGSIEGGGDIVKYRIIAKDNSTAQNTAMSPATGFHTITVEGSLPARTEYANNFNAATTDFFGNNFSIATPSGFSNPALHTDHPYIDGEGQPNNEFNYIYQLKIPIIISATNPWMKFDEIALIEPGEAGSVFGSAEFFDYVIVEGSEDNGATWKRLVDGYDARDKSQWLTRYNSITSGQNSTATGDPSLYKTRYLNLTKLTKPNNVQQTGFFTAGDEILIRFRLFIDAAAHGWGWAIDNLEIQGNVTAIEEVVGGAEGIKLFPNPAVGLLNVEAELKRPNQGVEISLSNMLGVTMYRSQFKNTSLQFKQKLDIDHLPAGMYLMNMAVNNQTVSKKVFIR